MHNLKHHTLKALKWNFAGTIGMQAIQFLISIILARLLLPSEFGLIAMLSLFMAIAGSVLDSGFGSALIQKKNVTLLEESSVFYFNVLISLFMFALMWVCAPWIASFFSEPKLIALSRFIGLNLIVNSLGLVQGARMTKRLDFKTQSQAAVIATLASGSIGVVLALKGWGVWSLAVQSVSFNFIRVALFWVLNSWRPLAQFSADSLASMFPYGSRLFISGLLNTVFDNAYYVIIGRLYSKSDLGFYSRSLSTQKLPVNLVTSIFSQVAFPAFSTLSDDQPRFMAAFRKSIILSGFAIFPLMLGLLVVARPLFLLVFTAKWEPSIVYFQILCLAGMLMPLHALNLSVLMALGRSDLFLRLEIVKKIAIAVTIILTYRFGILAMVWGQFVSSIICLAINTHYSGALIHYPMGRQLSDLLPSLVLSAVMAGLVYLVGTGLVDNTWMKLATQVSLGAVIYLGGSALLRLSPVFELRKLAGGRLSFLNPLAAE